MRQPCCRRAGAPAGRAARCGGDASPPPPGCACSAAALATADPLGSEGSAPRGVQPAGTRSGAARGAEAGLRRGGAASAPPAAGGAARIPACGSLTAAAPGQAPPGSARPSGIAQPPRPRRSSLSRVPSLLRWRRCRRAGREVRRAARGRGRPRSRRGRRRQLRVALGAPARSLVADAKRQPPPRHSASRSQPVADAARAPRTAAPAAVG
jgi:hypothetical protein